MSFLGKQTEPFVSKSHLLEKKRKEILYEPIVDQVYPSFLK
jgi:hypothetical protein